MILDHLGWHRRKKKERQEVHMGKQLTATDEENFELAQKEEENAARGAHGQVMKKSSGWHRRKEKERASGAQP